MSLTFVKPNNKAMAKAISKPAPKAETKLTVKAPAKKAPAKQEKALPDYEAISKTVLEKLIVLKLDQQLQADLEWCIGSYSHDKNPVGLLEALNRASELFTSELAKKTKGVTAAFVKSIDAVIKG
jgi:hypothetical protein